MDAFIASFRDGDDDEDDAPSLTSGSSSGMPELESQNSFDADEPANRLREVDEMIHDLSIDGASDYGSDESSDDRVFGDGTSDRLVDVEDEIQAPVRVDGAQSRALRFLRFRVFIRSPPLLPILERLHR